MTKATSPQAGDSNPPPGRREAARALAAWASERAIPDAKLARLVALTYEGRALGWAARFPYRHAHGERLDRLLTLPACTWRWPRGANARGALMDLGLARAGLVVIVEGESDAIRLALALGERGRSPRDEVQVLALPGASMVPEASDLEVWIGGRMVVVATDADQAGDRAALRLAERIGRFVTRFRPEPERDLRSLLDAQRPTPRALAEALAGAPKVDPPRPRRHAPARQRPGTDAMGTSFGEQRMRAVIAHLTDAEEGGRNDALNVAAYTLGGLVAGGQIEEAYARMALGITAEGLGLKPQEIKDTIDSGVANGRRAPIRPQQEGPRWHNNT